MISTLIILDVCFHPENHSYADLFQAHCLEQTGSVLVCNIFVAHYDN